LDGLTAASVHPMVRGLGSSATSPLLDDRRPTCRPSSYHTTAAVASIFSWSRVPKSDRSSHRYYDSVSRFLGGPSREGPCDAWWPSELASSPNSRGNPPPVRFRKTEKLNDRKIRTAPGSKGPSFCRYIFLSFRFGNSARLDARTEVDRGHGFTGRTLTA
jgi:hypothetical protein